MIHPLQKLSSIRLEIVWHENRTIYLSVKKEGGGFLLRLHRLFYNAPTPVLEAILCYVLKRDKNAKIVIRQMVHLHFSKNKVEAKQLHSKGRIYDLQEIFEKLQQILPVQDVSIGWSKRGGKGRFRSITFGTYNGQTRQIRIHPILDQKEVPLYFLEYIVYHEMLHSVCPTQMDAQGRRSVHTKQFREKERQFPFFQEAKEWEKKSLTILKKVSRGRS